MKAINRTMDIRTLLKKWEIKAVETGLQSPEVDTEYIFSEALGMPRLELKMQGAKPLSFNDISKIDALMKRRISGEPLQYILGKAYFRKLCLSIGPGVLIPRPETELIIDLAAPYIGKGTRIADIGTGSGAIALAAGSEFPDSVVTGIDISNAALVRAESNRLELGIKNVSFVKGDLLAGFPENSFDVILSNPPYVTDSEYDALPSEVKDYEPENALRAGPDGLDVIRKLLDKAVRVLVKGGVIIIECGAGQSAALERIVDPVFFSVPEMLPDLTGRFRFLKVSKS